jgi:hypothetical protein
MRVMSMDNKQILSYLSHHQRNFAPCKQKSRREQHKSQSIQLFPFFFNNMLLLLLLVLQTCRGSRLRCLMTFSLSAFDST